MSNNTGVDFKNNKNGETSVGIVTPEIYKFGNEKEPFVLESGKTLYPLEIAYETYGKPDKNRANAILILHALSGDSHAAGYYEGDTKPGWWDNMIGPGRAFDTDKYWVICSNIIGGCKGSTGPGSINPETGKQYGSAFPVITVGDIVAAQKKLIEHLGIKKLLCAAGGSMGGFQVLEWALRYPEMVESAAFIASGARTTAQGIAFNAISRKAIMSDPGWKGGDYYGTPGPVNGLSIARMIGHITYLSEESMDSKFGRRLQYHDALNYDTNIEFAVESYLEYQGEKFIKRFDANSYVYITKAIDYHDVERVHGHLVNAFKKIKSKFLIVSYSSDWLFPPAQVKEIYDALIENEKNAEYHEIHSPYGHDAFLVEVEQLSDMVTPFLTDAYKIYL